MNDHHVPLIYNVFPKLAGPADKWISHVQRAASMGFNWVYLNPLTMPGFSGSLYATKDYFLLNPEFLPSNLQGKNHPLDILSTVFQRMRGLNVELMADLVINHTSIDSSLLRDHPSWFIWDQTGKVRNPCAVDPDDPTKKTIWGDLAEIDNWHSPDREALWAYWWEVVHNYIRLGFTGFRCDAAYQVPSELWRFLIERAHHINPKVVFWAENLGCTVEQTRALRDAGFQLFCNSSKWWNFEDAWCLDQHREFEDLPSVSFPETHDTPRLACESGGNEAVQRQRYAFASTFSAGLMMPIGYEFGYQKKLDVVKTRPEDQEQPLFDLTDFIQAVHHLKGTLPLLQGEGCLWQVPSSDNDVVILFRESARNERGWILINRSVDESRQLSTRSFADEQERLRRLRLTNIDKEPAFAHGHADVVLNPADVILVVADR